MILEILLTVSIILFLISLLVISNLLYKVEVYETTFERILPILQKLQETIITSNTKLKELDTTGGFESDDEIGFFFNTVKALQQQLNELVIQLNDSNEEKV